MRFVVLDTDIASRSIRGRLPTPLARKLVGCTWCVTFVTVAELYRWAKLRDFGTRERADLERWLNRVSVLDSTASVTQQWAEITAGAISRGQPRAVNNSWIAACRVAHGLPLASTKLRAFIDFAEHDGLVLITS